MGLFSIQGTGRRHASRSSASGREQPPAHKRSRQDRCRSVDASVDRVVVSRQIDRSIPIQDVTLEGRENMALATRAQNAIANYPPGMGITCHQAVWFWAAEEATAQGLVPPRPLLTRMGNIANMPGGAQGAMLRLPRVCAFDFNTGATPPPGTVLLWITGPTHSAVVTQNGISGYNQSCIFPHLPALGNYSTCAPAQLGAGQKLCYLIAENDIVKAAGGVFHL